MAPIMHCGHSRIQRLGGCQPGTVIHVFGDDDLYPRCPDLSAHGNYFTVLHMHGPAWDIAQRRVHGHEMRVTNDKFSPWPDIGGRTPYAFRILCTLRKEG